MLPRLHRAPLRGELAAVAGAGTLAVLTALVVAAGPRTPPPYDGRIDPATVGRAQAAPVALVIGDDVVAATADVAADQTFAARACAARHWICNVDAGPGTGYVTDGRSEGDTDGSTDGNADGNVDGNVVASYGGRVATNRAHYLADAVVVLGGRNDLRAAGDVQAAARRLFVDLEKAYPQARIVVVEPFAIGPPSKDVVRLRSAVQTAARSAGVRWVNSDTWLHRGDLAADGVHLTPAGHRALVAPLADLLAGLAPATPSA